MNTQLENVITSEENFAGGRIPLTHKMTAKVTAFMLTLIMLFVFAASVLGAVMMYEYGVYNSSKEKFCEEALETVVYSDAYEITQCVVYHNIDRAEEICLEHNIAEVTVTDVNSDKMLFEFSKDTRTPDDKVFTTQYTFEKDHPDTGKMTPYGYVIDLRLSENLTIEDEYYTVAWLASIVFAFRYWIYPIGVISFIISIASFLFLMCSSGRRADSPDIQPGWGTSVPFDITTAALAAASAGMIYFLTEGLSYGPVWAQLIGCCAVVISIVSMCLGWCMSFALRVKLGKWWKNTVIFYALVLLWKIIKAIFRGIGRAGRACGRFIGQIHMVWRTAIIMAVISGIELVALLATQWNHEALILLWIAAKVIEVPLVLYLAMALRKLQKGGDALADGDLSYQVDTKRLFWDFRRHGENLNSIAAGMNRAVDQRLKSERMKTELITNVSHDIKTPLTSIINYSDLICKEECDNEKITEYADVLHRQSERLKRLIEDLVEASKASTGNLEVNLSPCEVGVMLTQTVGEYQQKLKNADLELITSQPDVPIAITQSLFLVKQTSKPSIP